MNQSTLAGIRRCGCTFWKEGCDGCRGTRTLAGTQGVGGHTGRLGHRDQIWVLSKHRHSHRNRLQGRRTVLGHFDDLTGLQVSAFLRTSAIDSHCPIGQQAPRGSHTGRQVMSCEEDVQPQTDLRILNRDSGHVLD
jgi:hypothetical protein